MDKLSIIVPVYNQENSLLRRAILSAVNQYGVETEVVIVDDGSTDDCVKSTLFELDLDMNAFNIKSYKHETNQGVAAALNTGIKEASHDYIAWLSSDDYFYPEKSFVQLFNMADTKTKFSFTGFRELITKAGKINQIHNWPLTYGYGIIKADILYGDLIKKFPSCFINGASTIFHKDVIEKVGEFDTELKYMQDYDMWLKISKEFDGLCCGDIFMVKTSHENQMAYIFGEEHFKKCRKEEEAILSNRYSVGQ